ncbi:hypothetical protein XELAEV_18006790mg [Xenopus laevis]|uniref:GIY-YIG domain-containing protein n=1 Tax=Xenopus laevis TaxID=8355 RepID=A0A974DZX5_XENLA|nr:hypothetical protein XELAEV_18006790mg [Xenopus laevis]
MYINCNTKSVVYLLACISCCKQYVGCAIQVYKKRIREHLNSIKSGSQATLFSRHFRACNNGNIGMLKALGIERVTLGLRGVDLQCKLLLAEILSLYMTT